MTHHGLRFHVRHFCGAPLVSAEGQADAWQFEMLRNLLNTFKDRGHDNVIVDLTRVQIAGDGGAGMLSGAIQSWHPHMNIHVVAAGEVAQLLGLQSFPFRAHLCSSLDEAAEYICKMKRTPDYHVEQNIERHYEVELPLAA